LVFCNNQVIASQPASQPILPPPPTPLLPGAVAEAASAYSPRSRTCYSGIHKTHNTKSTKHKTYTQNTKGRFINTKHFLLLLHQAWTFSFLSSPHPFGVLQQRVISINFSSSKDTISHQLFAIAFLQKDASLSYYLHFAFLQKDANFIYYLQLLLFLFTHLCASSNIHQLLFFKRCKPSLLFAILFFFFFFLTQLFVSSNIY
jgi:hypothetical protein